MITQQEKESILRNFQNIQKAIDSILSMLIKYEEHFDIIKNVLNSFFPSDNMEAAINSFCKKKNDLLSIKESFSKAPTLDNSISIHYKTFLNTELSRFNPEAMNLLQTNIQHQVYQFIEQQSIQESNAVEPNNQVIDWIKNIPNQYTTYINSLFSLQCRLNIFNNIKDIDGSIVMIGANGSGKTSFARQLNGKLANNIVILSAQHILYYNKRNTISAAGNEIQKVRDFQFNTKVGTDSNFQQLLTSDMNDLIGALMAQHTDCAYELFNNGIRNTSFLSKTIELWDSIIEHRSLLNDRTGIYVTGNNIGQYNFNQLSDGEKAVFYYIAHIMLAPDNSYIVVDEPENHLHLTICNKLWDKLENERRDCKFIYLTHDLNFATTRTNCTILWNKKFIPPSKWDFEILPSNEIIPEVLLMELVGSRKNICFCEGNTKSSIDYKLYSILFPQYTVIPAAGHRNVIDYVEAYNSTSAFITQAIGIIDGDHHLPEQISKWHQKKIYTLPINEIENILCDNVILQKAIDTFCSTPNALDNFHEEFWKLLSNNKEQQATAYVNEYINNLFKENFLHEKQNLASLITELQSITSTEYIQNLYNTTLSKIEKFIEDKDYSSALHFVNFKGRLTKDIAKKTIVDKYENRVLNLISKNPELREYIINTYFSNFTF